MKAFVMHPQDHWRPRKGLGQNFLQDPLVAERMVTLAGVQPGDRVVEIGPGFGALTRPLLQRVGQVLAIEVDEALIPALQRSASGWGGALTLLAGDARTVDFTGLAAHLGGRLRLVANLPYSVSSDLLFHFLEQRAAFQDLTVMLQKEVAERLTAQPGTRDYGALSVRLQLWAAIDMLFDVPATAFRPVPKVTSSVVRLTMRSAPWADVGDPQVFRQVVRLAFNQRRKTLANALASLLPGQISSWLTAMGVDPRRRGETLSVAEFAALARALTLVLGASPRPSPSNG